MSVDNIIVGFHIISWACLFGIYCITSFGVMLFGNINPIKNQVVKKIVGTIFFPGLWIFVKIQNLFR